ncbi:MAG: hypothetical protein EXR07_10525 [Acetobacteraceae bacterium]|nr:hypothetical protein [Acetobacteraceae bacterium]
MSDSPFRLALAPLAARLPRVVQEHEILRVAGEVEDHDSAQVAEAVRKHVLSWVQNRSGGRLPADAWSGDSFEYLAGGRNSIGIRLRDTESDVWAIRADDPDKDIPDRVWTTEIAIGAEGAGPLQFGARLLVSTAEGYPDIEPHVPGFVMQIAERHSLFRGSYRIEPQSWHISDRSGAEELADMLVDPERKLPLYVVTCSEGSDEPLLDTVALAKAVTGIGLIVVLPAEFTRVLTERFGRFLSVFGGAVRAYLPGFEAGCRPYDHKLFLASRLNDQSDIKQCEKWVRIHAATESRRNLRLDRDIPSFDAIRSESAQRSGRNLGEEGASDSRRLLVAQDHIESLKNQLLEAENYQEYFSKEADRSEERAAVLRIQQLEDSRSTEAEEQTSDDDLPGRWDAFVNWCDVRLAGRVTLVPSARRSTKSPDCEDTEQAACCLLWSGSVCRDNRIGNVNGSLRDEPVEAGIYNSPCGSDTFEFEWQGQRLLAGWHIKNGGNTREPRRCLRIYHGWDPDTQQIVIAEMPAHRRTGAS